MRYSAAILWGRHGDVHGGTPWPLHCAYKNKEAKNKMNNSSHGLMGHGALLITFVLARSG
jgi:hypothetical protein